MITEIWKSLFLMILMAGLGACSTKQEKKSILYKAIVFDEAADRSLNDGYVDTIEINYDEGVIKYSGGRVMVEFSDCGNDAWICISDGNTEFAIRRDWHERDKSWSYRNMIYSVVQEATPRSRGDETYFILAAPEKNFSEKISPKIYLFSKEKGIIGIIQVLRGHDGALVNTTYIRVYE